MEKLKQTEILQNAMVERKEFDEDDKRKITSRDIYHIKIVFSEKT